jgi:hypothetical protein
MRDDQTVAVAQHFWTIRRPRTPAARVPRTAMSPKAAGPLVVTLAKELACIMQGEDRVHESPGQQNCAHAQHDVVRVPRLSNLGYNRSETGEGCRRGEHQKRDRAFIIAERPRAFAVLKLITSSNLVDRCTGMSAGFSPLTTRPV